MMFSFTPQQEAWRQEVRRFCEAHVSDAMRLDAYRSGNWHNETFYKALARQNWLGLPWPTEYGGKGLSHVMMGIFNEELAYYEAPVGLVGTTVNLLGNALRTFGTEEQRQRWLPQVANGEVTVSELLSEPEAGSDAANCQMRAVPDGDGWVVNGVKIFNDGDVATHGLASVRTDPNAPKHRGVSLMLLDTRGPGITVAPLFTYGHRRRAMLVFDGVQVPRDRVLGQLHRGWYHMAQLLDLERSSTGRVGTARRSWERIVEYVKEHNLNRHAWVREALADRWRELQMARLTDWHVCVMQDTGQVPSFEASASKIVAVTASINLWETCLEILGRYGALLGRHGALESDYLGRPSPETEASQKHAPLRGWLNYMWRECRSDALSGGSLEAQRIIVARRGLELPR